MEKYVYADDLDILYVNNNPFNEKSIGNLNEGNLIIDVGNSGRVLGVEIDCASKFFNLSKEQIQNLDVKIKTIKTGTSIILALMIACGNKERIYYISTNMNKSLIPC